MTSWFNGGKVRMKNSRKQRRNKFIAAALAAAMVFTVFPTTQVSAENNEFASQEQLDELERLKEKEKELASAQAQLDADMNAVKSEVANLQSQSAGLSSQLEQLMAEDVVLKQDYERLQKELKEAEEFMKAAISAYEDAKADVDEKQKEYELRMVAMYKRSNQSILDILMQSDGISGFFTNLQLISVIAKSDQDVLQELTTARETAQVKKMAAEESKKQYDEFVAAKAKEIEELAKGIRNKESEISAVQSNLLNRSSDLNNLQEQFTVNAQERSNIQSQSSDIQGEIDAQAEATRAAWAEATRAAEAAKQASAPSGGAGTVVGNPSSYGLVHPAPGTYGITSYYGWRGWPLDPNSGYDFHTGIDFGGNFGDPVVAANDGVVVRVNYPFPNANYGGYYSGVANYVIIDHGNGMQTAYWHLKSVEVYVGQRVSRGQRIGGIGSTGYSTGPHLHFEVRFPGSPSAGIGSTVDPYPYLFS